VVTLKNHATGHDENSHIEFIKDLHTEEEHWYLLEQSPENRHWYTDQTRKVAVANTWGLGFWAETDPQHPNYTVGARPSSQSAGPQISRTQSTQSEPHEESLSGGLHHIVTLSGMHPLAPETQNAPLTQHLYDTAAAGGKVPTNIAPLAPHIDIMSGITASTTVIQNPAPPTAPGNGGGGLYGTSPALFTGDRNKSKDFMRAFNQWWKLNKEKPVFSQPYKRVALFLNHLRGLNVED